MSETVETEAPKKRTRKAKDPLKQEKQAKKKEAAATAEGGRRGRPSAFSGKTIHKLVKENPRREGTHGHASFALIRSGMTYEKYIEAGGRRQDLAWDIDKGFVEVR